MAKRQREWRNKNPERAHANANRNRLKHRDKLNKNYREHYWPIRRARRYGLTPEQWNELFQSQGQCCAVCKITTANTWHTDHDHKTNKLRGILCHHCNLALGNVRDSIETLTALIAYLKETI